MFRDGGGADTGDGAFEEWRLSEDDFDPGHLIHFNFVFKILNVTKIKQLLEFNCFLM